MASIELKQAEDRIAALANSLQYLVLPIEIDDGIFIQRTGTAEELIEQLKKEVEERSLAIFDGCEECIVKEKTIHALGSRNGGLEKIRDNWKQLAEKERATRLEKVGLLKTANERNQDLRIDNERLRKRVQKEREDCAAKDKTIKEARERMAELEEEVRILKKAAEKPCDGCIQRDATLKEVNDRTIGYENDFHQWTKEADMWKKEAGQWKKQAQSDSALKQAESRAADFQEEARRMRKEAYKWKKEAQKLCMPCVQKASRLMAAEESAERCHGARDHWEQETVKAYEMLTEAKKHAAGLEEQIAEFMREAEKTFDERARDQRIWDLRADVETWRVESQYYRKEYDKLLKTVKKSTTVDASTQTIKTDQIVIQPVLVDLSTQSDNIGTMAAEPVPSNVTKKPEHIEKHFATQTPSEVNKIDEYIDLVAKPTPPEATKVFEHNQKKLLLFFFVLLVGLYLWHAAFGFENPSYITSFPGTFAKCKDIVLLLSSACHITLKQFVISPKPIPPTCDVNYSNITLGSDFAAVFSSAFIGGAGLGVGAFGT